MTAPGMPVSTLPHLGSHNVYYVKLDLWSDALHHPRPFHMSLCKTPALHFIMWDEIIDIDNSAIVYTLILDNVCHSFFTSVEPSF